MFWQKNYGRFHQVYQFHQIRLGSPFDGGYSLQRETDGLIKRTSSMLDEIASKIVDKDKEGDWERKKK